jgi:hypothetical protein
MVVSNPLDFKLGPKLFIQGEGTVIQTNAY